MDRSPDADSRLWLLLPRSVRNLPADLAAVVVLVVLTSLAATVPGVRDTPLRVVLGLPMVLFVPGYALVAALFPEAGEGPTGEDDVERERDGIDGIERVALSFGLSIAVVPLIGLVLNFTPWGLRLIPILVGVGGFSLVMTGVAARRRWDLPVEERFSVPYRSWMQAGYNELTQPETRVDSVLNVVLILSVVLATSSVVYAVAVPSQGESFSEFYLLTHGDDSTVIAEDGELVAADYPTEFILGESRPIVVGIGNHENDPVSYTVVVELQKVSTENNETTVVRERELSQFESPQLADNETWQTTRQITPAMGGEQLRLTYLLYRDGAPADPTIQNSYRELHLWINVSRA